MKLGGIALVAVAFTSVAASAPAPFQTGDWEVTTKAQFSFAPGTPPIVARMLAAQTAAPQVRHHCVTSADLATSPGAVLAISGGICRYRKSNFSDGHMTLQTECNGANGEHTITDIDGSYTPTTFKATGSKRSVSPTGTTMAIATTGRRIGTCNG